MKNTSFSKRFIEILINMETFRLESYCLLNLKKSLSRIKLRLQKKQTLAIIFARFKYDKKQQTLDLLHY